MKADHSLPHSIAQLKSSNINHVPQRPHINGHRFPSPAANRESLAPQENLSDEDEEESGLEEEEEEEEEDTPRKWQGIEAIFEAYQEYVDGESV